PGTTTARRDEPIPQDWQSWWNFPNFGEFLYRGSFTYTFTLQKALILEVHLQGKADVTDLDLGVFRDVNDNGVLDVDEVKDANSRNRGGTDGKYGGAVLLGLPGAPGILVIPVSVGLDRLPPSIASFSLSTLHGRLNRADNRTTTDAHPSLSWSLADPGRGELDSSRVSLALDGNDVTSDAGVDLALLPNAQGVRGFWRGTLTYHPNGLGG